MFSTFPHLSFGSGSEDSESSNESPPTFPDITKPPPDQTIFCTWDPQRSQDLAVKLLECQRESQSQSAAVEEQRAAFDSSVPPPGFVSSTNPR